MIMYRVRKGWAELEYTGRNQYVEGGAKVEEGRVNMLWAGLLWSMITVQISIYLVMSHGTVHGAKVKRAELEWS